jgi:hypothetical protein
MAINNRDFTDAEQTISFSERVDLAERTCVLIHRFAQLVSAYDELKPRALSLLKKLIANAVHLALVPIMNAAHATIDSEAVNLQWVFQLLNWTPAKAKRIIMNLGQESVELLETSEAKATLKKLVESIVSSKKTVILWTEGKTDWKHLKAAFVRLKSAGRFPELDIQFQEDEKNMGNKELLHACSILSRYKIEKETTVLVFDRDDPDMMSKVTNNDMDYKYWGNNVYSVVLPVPDHRLATPNISIEFYYQDQEIMQMDNAGRRLFIGTEFSERTGRHKTERYTCADKNKLGKFTVIDSQVFHFDDVSENNIAMTKDQFANYILDGEENFNTFELNGFVRLFDLIETLAEIKIT